MRDGLTAGGHKIWASPTHAEQPAAHCGHGSRHAGYHVCGNDDAASSVIQNFKLRHYPIPLRVPVKLLVEFASNIPGLGLPVGAHD
jgi:hypothetical protein